MASSDSVSVTGTVLNEMNNMYNTMADGMSSAVKDTSDTVTNAVQNTNENLSTYLKNSGSTAIDFGTKATESVQNLVKAGSRYPLSFGNLCAQLFDRLSATTDQHSLSVRTLSDGPVPGSSVTGTALGEMNEMSKKMADGMSSAVKSTSDSLSSAVQDTNEHLTTFVENSSSTAMNFGSKATESVQNLVTTGNQYTHSIGDLCAELFNRLRATTVEHSLLTRAPADEPASGSVAETATDNVATAVKGVTDGVANVTQNTGNNISSLIKNAGSTITEFGTETGKSVEEAIRASGRVTLAIGNLCTQLFNGLSFTVATGTGYLANGFNGVDSYVGRVPVLGVVSSGLSKLVTGVSGTFSDISQHGRESRDKMFKELREQLNQSGGYVNQSATTGSTDDSSASTASP